MYNILVVGAGYLGGTVARYFRTKNQRVWTLNHTDARKKEFEEMGAQPIMADLTDPSTLTKIPPAQFIVICPAPDKRDEESYRKVYLEGIGNFLKAIAANPRPYLIVYTSSTSVWGDMAGHWVDESILPDPDSEYAKILVKAEDQILNSGFPSVIFRLSGIYGPGRNRIKSFRQGKMDVEGPDRYMNMIHVDDIAAAMLVLFKKSKAGNIYLGVDDEPVLHSEFCRWLGEKMRMAVPPVSTGKKVIGKRCRNHLLKELDFTFQYPTFRDGYETLLEKENQGM